MTVVGIQNVDYTNRNQRHVRGQYLYLAEDIQNGAGIKVDRVFISQTKLDSLSKKLELNSSVEIFYNKYGNITKIEVVDPENNVYF